MVTQRQHKKVSVRADGSYEQALLEMQHARPDLSRVVQLLSRAMKSADHRATYALGTWYLHGRHFDRDEKKGLRLIAKAARHGVPDALFDLAVSLETGIGVKKDLRRAALTYLRAALLGNERSIYEVGRCLYHGIGFASDRAAAKEWYEKARRVDRGDTLAGRSFPRARSSVRKQKSGRT